MIGPARLAGDKAQLQLPGNRIHFVDHTVDIEGQALTQLGHTGMKPSQALRADSPVPVFANRQAESRQRIQHATVGVGLGPTLDFTETIGEEGQRTPGGDARVELTQAACGRIAGIDEYFLPGGFLGAIEALEIVSPHEDFTAHLEHRRCIAVQVQRDLAQRAYVAGHILAGAAIAAGGRQHEHARFIAQADCEAVKLEFGRVSDGRRRVVQPQGTAHAGIEGDRALIGGVGFGADRQHRHRMMHGRQLGRRLAADALGR